VKTRISFLPVTRFGKIYYTDHPHKVANILFRDKLQNREDFKDGSLDIDGLCSELRAKARCSESGVVIDQQDVDSALQRLPASRANSGQM
jgi:hypothetical protein